MHIRTESNLKKRDMIKMNATIRKYLKRRNWDDTIQHLHKFTSTCRGMCYTHP